MFLIRFVVRTIQDEMSSWDFFFWAFSGPERVFSKNVLAASRKNRHWFLGVLCRMPSKDENNKKLEYQRWLTVHKPIQPMLLYRFPSTSFKSSWPRCLGNVWIKKISFDVLIAPACPRHCNGPRLCLFEGTHDWANVFVVCMSQCLALKQVLKQKWVKLLGPIVRRPRSHPQHQVTFDTRTGKR